LKIIDKQPPLYSINSLTELNYESIPTAGFGYYFIELI